MAEALAVIGLVASIVQLASTSSKIVHLFHEFHSSGQRTPKIFRDIKAKLPLLQEILWQIKEAADAGVIENRQRPALRSAIDGCQEHIQVLNIIVTRALPSSDDSTRTRIKKTLRSLRQEAKVKYLTNALHEYVCMFTLYLAAVSATPQIPLGQKTENLREWLSGPNPSLNYQKAIEQWQPGTSLWFFENAQYDKWKKVPASFLWIQGIPGCGKTVLVSKIVQNVKYYKNNPRAAVSYFYFDFRDPNKQAPRLMVKSLISQLVVQCETVPRALEEVLLSREERGGRYHTLGSFLQLLRRIVDEFSQVYIIIDALDECASRDELMNTLKDMVGWKCAKLHILVTSRNNMDIESSPQRLEEMQNIIWLQGQLVNKDIHTYIRQRLSNDMSLHKWQKHPDIQQEIEDKLMEGAHGMIRWAACQLDTLGKCPNPRRLREALATLPPTLDEMYERILCEIDKVASEHAVRMLRWLAFSKRPLRVEELAEVAALEAERRPAFIRDEVIADPSDILNICSSLVTIDKADGTQPEKCVDYSPSTGNIIRLTHSSVREYLLSEQCRRGRAARYSIDNIACNEWIAKSCLDYLQFQDSDFSSVEEIREFKLAQYAATYWVSHAQVRPELEDALSQRILQLFSDKRAFLNWLRLYDPDYSWSTFDANKKLEESQTPLYYASLFGLVTIVQALVSKSITNVNAKGGRYGNALQAASYGGHTEVVNLLLCEGADANAQGGRYGNALQAASHKGHEKVVRVLLCQEANIGAKGGVYGTALQAASYGGHDNIVELLIQKGADVNIRSGKLGTALQAASYRGHSEIVELLLNNGADIDTQDGTYDNALQAALCARHEEVTELLLSKRPNVNIQGGLYGNVLQAASYAGQGKTVELLLDMGSHVNAQGGEYGNALQAAALGGYTQIVELLLDRGADINALSGVYGSALHAASYGGHKNVVKLLLFRGADVNAQGGKCISALHATLQGKHDVAELLDEKVDPTTPNRSGRSLLSKTAGSDHIKVAKILLNHGADPTVPNEDGEMPFHSAAILGEPHFLKVLLSPPININALCKRYGTALHAAAYKRHLGILETLVEIYNADITVTDELGRTPLHLAARGGDVRCVDYLISKGLRCSDEDKNGYNVIHYACSSASIEVVRRVLYFQAFTLSRPNSWTPLHWAYRTGDCELVNLLRQHGYHDSSVHTAQPSASWNPISIGLFHRNPHVESALQMPLTQEFAVSNSTHLDTASLSNAKSVRYPYGFYHEDFLCNLCFNDIHGPRFHCNVCNDFDLCFMCWHTSEKRHVGHDWQVLNSEIGV